MQIWDSAHHQLAPVEALEAKGEREIIHSAPNMSGMLTKY